MAKEVLEKILSSNEEIKYQFSFGETYLRISKIMTIAIGSSILILLGVFGLPALEIDILFIVLIVGALVGLLTGYSFFYFGWFLKRTNIYVISNRRVIIHIGWLSTRVTSVDFRQITDIKVIQPFFEKVIFGTGILKINTAGMEAHPIILSHIEDPYKIKKIINEIRHSLSH